MAIIKTDQPFNNERLLDYDPYTGIKTYFSSGGKEGEFWSVRSEFDSVAPELEGTKALRNDDEHWKKGVKQSWVHYGHVPDAILLKWYQMGVNINDPKELIRMINRPEWSYLKCTDKVHA